MQVWCYTQCWFGSGSHCGSSQKFQVSQPGLEPFMLLQQDPRASWCWIPRSNRCLKSGTALGFAAAFL